MPMGLKIGRLAASGGENQLSDLSMQESRSDAFKGSHDYLAGLQASQLNKAVRFSMKPTKASLLG